MEVFLNVLRVFHDVLRVLLCFMSFMMFREFHDVLQCFVSRDNRQSPDQRLHNSQLPHQHYAIANQCISDCAIADRYSYSK